MNRTQIIQSLINKINGKKYLEIGVGDGGNFNNIICENKVSVEPHPMVNVTFTLTSDDFFKQNNDKFDVIFIDGLHEYQQVYRDIENSLKFLNENGYIICHDMNPHSEIIQRYPQEASGEWTGDCWKAWVLFKTKFDDLSMFTIDTDYGCGIITRGSQKLIEVKEELTWDLLNNDRIKLLNLISVEDFKQML